MLLYEKYRQLNCDADDTGPTENIWPWATTEKKKHTPPNDHFKGKQNLLIFQTLSSFKTDQL